jgi:DNA-binding transcriptional MerR regulator/quercetin dioxygenase-like cupin family protein
MPRAITRQSEPAPIDEPLGLGTITIGEFSRITGIRPSVLRDWELHGIVTPARTGSHRRYSEKDLVRVKAAQRLRSRNFNPSAIAEMLGPNDASEDGGDVRLKIGPTLRDARKVARLTLVEVAARVDCSPSHLSSVERGASTPSMSLLHRVAEVYGIDVANVFGAFTDVGPVQTKAFEVAPYVSDEGALRVWSVARTASICADIYEAEPGAGSQGSYRHEGEEYIFVFEGEFDVILEGYGTYHLGAGEALSFSSSIPHEWCNDSSAPVRMLWTNTHPELKANSCALSSAE